MLLPQLKSQLFVNGDRRRRVSWMDLKHWRFGLPLVTKYMVFSVQFRLQMSANAELNPQRHPGYKN